MGAADLRDDPRLAVHGPVPTVETTDDLGSGYTAGVGWRVYDEARRRGAYLRPLGDVVYVTPPLEHPDGGSRTSAGNRRRECASRGRATLAAQVPRAPT